MYQNEKNDSNPRVFTSTFQGLIEKIVKMLPAILGSLYLCGFVITAIRLSKYHTPAIKLIDAQYFTAGLLIGPLIWVTLFVVFSAFSYNSRKEDAGKQPLWFRLQFAFFVLIVLFLIASSNITRIVQQPYSRGEIIFTVLIYLIAIIGSELGLWVIIVIIRTRRFIWEKPFSKLSTFSFNIEDKIDQLFIKFMRILLGVSSVAFFLIFTCMTIYLWLVSLPGIYEFIPQSFGGGLPISVQLYVDTEKIPKVLLIDDDRLSPIEPGLTKPMKLILRTSDEYIVSLENISDPPTWIINNSIVYGVVVSANGIEREK